MKRLVFVVVLACAAMMCFTTGCTNGKHETANAGDSLADTLAADTTDTLKEDSVAETAPMPKAADKLFADFFFDFMSKKKVQMSRIQFPLRSVMGNKTKLIERKAWKMEHFYQNQEYYTQIFDDEKQMKAFAGADADSAIVEKIHLQEGLVEQYIFEHPEGKWMLTELRTVWMNQSKNASFLAFLQRFFSDKAFQMRSVKNPLPYYGPDPEGEDDAVYVKMRIPADTWVDYLPEIPGDQIYNILYGQKYGEGNEKIFLFKGLSNGLETQLLFKKTGGKWQLVKLNL
ncbi:MAG: DUF4348 domain-containing protein [Prevotella sp.]|nr:DUF4348 domain-containing protein [Prevotella sp.]